MTTEENNRREFEEWAEKDGYILSNMPSKLMTDFAWEAWQAARERQNKHLIFQRDKLAGYLRECVSSMRQQSLYHEQLMFLNGIKYFLEEITPPTAQPEP